MSSDQPLTEDLLPSQFEQLVLEHCRQPIWIFDLYQFRIIWANPAALTVWGADSLDELRARDLSSVSFATLSMDGHRAELQPGQEIDEQWTFYPGDQTTTLSCTCRGVTLADGRLGMLVQAAHVEDRRMSRDELRGVEALRHTPVIISLFTLDGAWLMRNPAAERVFGGPAMPKDSFVGRFLSKREGEQALADLREGSAFWADVQVSTAYGPRWHGLEARRTIDPATGAPVIVTSQRDVTDRKLAEDALRESESRFRALGMQAPIGIFQTNPEGRFIFVNRRWCEISGLPEESALGKGWESGIHADDRERVAGQWKRITENHMEGALEFRYSHENGTQRWVSGNAMPLYDASGALLGFLGTVADITERVVHEQRFRSLFEQSSEAHFFLDDAGRVVDANVAAVRVLRAKGKDDLLGKLVAELSPEHQPDGSDSREKNRTMLARAVLSGSHRFEWMHRRFDASEVLVEMAVTCLAFDGKRAFLASARDQTERKRAEEAIVRSREAALESLRLKSQFLANMSHEIRTPMNGVLGMLQLALGTQLSDETREFLTAAHASADGLLAIINDILDLSKIEAKKLDVESIELSVEDLMRETFLVTAGRAWAKGLELTVDLAPDLPSHIYGDPVRMRQVLTNLIGNATKFTETGVVATMVRTIERDDDQFLVFSVRDTGIGIPPARLEEVFSSFAQADGSTTRRFGGTGLGLTISRQLAGLMGGNLTVESEVGRGSTFFLELPLRASPAAHPTLAKSAEAAGRRVMIIDDHPLARDLMADAVLHLGYQPIVANSIDEAVGLSEQLGEPLYAALVDQSLPDDNALEFGTRLSATGKKASPRLVFIHAGGTVPGAALRTAGFERALRKPVLPSDLQRVLNGAELLVSSTFALTPAVTQTVSLAPLRVLLVDDHPINAHFVTVLLERQGHEVVYAANGAQGLAAFRGSHFDLILMDVQMPIMDGLEATRQIRALEGDARHIPIIALTANAMKGDADECLDAGMDRYLSKPIDVHALTRVLTELFGARPSETAKAAGAPARQTSALRPSARPPGVGESATSGAEPAFSRKELLERACGDVRFMAEVVQMFLKNHQELLSGVERAVASADPAAVRATAHRLKGALLLVCATPSARLAAALERAGREQKAELFEDLLAQLRPEMQRLTSLFGDSGVADA